MCVDHVTYYPISQKIKIEEICLLKLKKFFFLHRTCFSKR